MAKIIFLGTAGAVASKERDNTSLLVIDGKKKILIDCPGSIVAKLAKVNPVRNIKEPAPESRISNGVNIDYRKISNIFFTHSHPDHIYGLVSLIHSQYKLKNNLTIFATASVVKLIKKLVKLFGLNDETLYPAINYKIISDAKTTPFYNSTSLQIWAFRVKHSKESVGFKFLFGNKKISLVYSGDTARSTNLIESAKNCDYLIHDCFATSKIFKKFPELNKMHTSSLKLGEIAKQAHVKVLVPIHFATEVEFSMATILKEIKMNFKGKIILPKDFYALKLISQHS